MFFRQHTDGRRENVPLENLYGGPSATPCWIIGGGPSLATLPVREIARSPAPRLAVNLAGSGLLRPTFWTSYDPTARFHRSIYLDPSVTKFVHACRAMDLVPGTTFKVCDCPATLLFDRCKDVGFHDFPGHGEDGITDWQDSLVQAIDIAWRLGFRRLYLAGCEMVIRPSPSLIETAEARGVRYEPLELLGRFVERCASAGMSRDEIEEHSTADQYHFDERKPLDAALQTDFHYFRVAQYLRLARRSLALAGLQIISVTPGSRLNGFFPFCEARQVCRRIRQRLGDPSRESTRGRYTNPADPTPLGTPPMRDFRPHHWPPAGPPARVCGAVDPDHPPEAADHRRLHEQLREIPVDLNEAG